MRYPALEEALEAYHAKFNVPAGDLSTAGEDKSQRHPTSFPVQQVSPDTATAAEDVDVSSSSADATAMIERVQEDAEHKARPTDDIGGNIFAEDAHSNGSNSTNGSGSVGNFESARDSPFPRQEDAQGATGTEIGNIRDTVNTDGLASSHSPSVIPSPIQTPEDFTPDRPADHFTLSTPGPVVAPVNHGAMTHEPVEATPPKLNTNTVYPPVTDANTFKEKSDLIVSDEWTTLNSCDQIPADISDMNTNFNMGRGIFCYVPRVSEKENIKT